MDQAQALTSGESIAKAAERCGIDPTTAFRWRHRFLSALNLDKPTSLSGIVEADETFILESLKGKRGGLPRPSRERGWQGDRARLVGRTNSRHRRSRPNGRDAGRRFAEARRRQPHGGVGRRHRPSTDFCCDGGSAITAFARRAKLNVHVLPAPGNPRPEAPEHHINNVNGYHGRLKEWMRRFHGVATKNLASYLSWRRTTEALGVAMAAAGMRPYPRRTQV
jgi:transposase-like protein